MLSATESGFHREGDLEGCMAVMAFLLVGS